jgi:hypothetical protein
MHVPTDCRPAHDASTRLQLETRPPRCARPWRNDDDDDETRSMRTKEHSRVLITQQSLSWWKRVAFCVIRKACDDGRWRSTSLHFSAHHLGTNKQPEQAVHSSSWLGMTREVSSDRRREERTVLTLSARRWFDVVLSSRCCGILNFPLACIACFQPRWESNHLAYNL